MASASIWMHPHLPDLQGFARGFPEIQPDEFQTKVTDRATSSPHHLEQFLDVWRICLPFQ